MPPKKVPYFKPGKELKDLINRIPDSVLEAGSVDTPVHEAVPEAAARESGGGQESPTES